MSVFKVFRHQIELLSRIGNSCDINQIFFYEHPHRRISMHLDMKHRESDVSYNIFAHEVHRGNQSLLSVMISCGIFPETTKNHQNFVFPRHQTILAKVSQELQKRCLQP